MKRLQRSFVVESKFPRKVSKEAANSIWGDTDLKAIARQIEDLVPGDRSATISIKVPRILLPVEPATRDRASSAIEAAGDPLDAATPSVTSVPPVGDAADEQPVTESPRVDSNKRRKHPKALAPRAVLDQTLPEKFDDLGQISMDWLNALESENKRLSSVLGKLLADENTRIQDAIDRMDTEGVSSLILG